MYVDLYDELLSWRKRKEQPANRDHWGTLHYKGTPRPMDCVPIFCYSFMCDQMGRRDTHQIWRNISVIPKAAYIQRRKKIAKNTTRAQFLVLQALRNFRISFAFFYFTPCAVKVKAGATHKKRSIPLAWYASDSSNTRVFLSHLTLISNKLGKYADRQIRQACCLFRCRCRRDLSKVGITQAFHFPSRWS